MSFIFTRFHEEKIKKYVDAGINRVILGTAAINNFPFLCDMVKKYGSQVPKEKISVEVSERYENIKDEKLYKRKGNADSFIRISRFSS